MGSCWQLLDKNQTRFPIPDKVGPKLGCVPRILIDCTKRVWPYRCLQQKDPNMLFLKKAISVYLSSVRLSKTKPR